MHGGVQPWRGGRTGTERRKRRGRDGKGGHGRSGGADTEDRRGAGTAGGGGAAEVPAGKAEPGQAHHRQRAVLEAAALGADGEGRRGRQSPGCAARQRVAGELHPQQARGRHGQLSRAHGAAERAGGSEGGGGADPHPAGDPEEQQVQEGVFPGVVEQAEIRVRRVRRVLGRRKAARAGGHRHPQHGRAEPVLGAGCAEHTGVRALLLHGTDTQQAAGGAVSAAGGQAGTQRRAGEPVSVR